MQMGASSANSSYYTLEGKSREARLKLSDQQEAREMRGLAGGHLARWCLVLIDATMKRWSRGFEDVALAQGAFPSWHKLRESRVQPSP
jgi:hypothetical protein